MRLVQERRISFADCERRESLAEGAHRRADGQAKKRSQQPEVAGLRPHTALSGVGISHPRDEDRVLSDLDAIFCRSHEGCLVVVLHFGNPKDGREQRVLRPVELHQSSTCFRVLGVTAREIQLCATVLARGEVLRGEGSCILGTCGQNRRHAILLAETSGRVAGGQASIGPTALLEDQDGSIPVGVGNLLRSNVRVSAVRACFPVIADSSYSLVVPVANQGSEDQPYEAEGHHQPMLPLGHWRLRRALDG
mmetsp:Transcript_35134/g.65443  ORF Transcript_35134/g.65443 Transcript_35134/m.65443 type:complete len:250 (+) Transcript_35134:82-831(+)